MNSREIILANIEHTPAPRPGMTFGGGRLNDMAWTGPGASKTYTPKRWTEGGREYYDDEWGNLWVRMVGGSVKGEIHTPALQSWDDLPKLQLPDYHDPDRWKGVREMLAQPTDRFTIVGIGGWIFDNARYLRKMENYFCDMAAEPEKIKQLNALVAGVYEAKIHHAGQAGADGIMIGEDLGTQNGPLFSPAMFREFFKADYTRLLGIAHDYGMKVLMHSCGNNWKLIDDLIDVGVDVFQFDQPALYDMPALAEKLRARGGALWSPVDIQKVLPTGDRAYIETQTHRMCETFSGMLICKDYPDLPGIGVKVEWDQWAYEAILDHFGLK
ncbi:MAG: uroporphyrinogen decarboxylase family protein [Planctomycetaceae bacterium]|nr:hypothetical protein [Planctomycetaceae bacterium]